ncbi:hypothetical protein BDV59DRAFT_208711 [Aspergillus ambiguus]|uniref:uncharacterized protein n=1 Tax=Aspergillus ambiguus TaxID=176160 RepID=UPI003CCD852C
MHLRRRTHNWGRVLREGDKQGELITSDDDSKQLPDKGGDGPNQPQQNEVLEEAGVSNEDLWMLIRRFNKVYFVAWALDVLTFLFTSTAAIMILFPPVQSYLFPPSPTSKGGAGGDGGMRRVDSLTGVSESHKGETAEREAENLVWDIAEVALDSARTEYDDQEESRENMHSPHGSTTIPQKRLFGEEDKTSQPMMEKVSKALVQAISIVSDITETYERFCNLLSPTPPFHLLRARLRLVSVLVVWGLCSLVISSYWLIKSTTFMSGLLFFGDPLFQRALRWLNNQFPDWKEEFDIKETLLDGVPTNAQLTLTLLRLGEMSSSPLAPPPGPMEKQQSTIKSHEKPLVLPPAESLVLDVSGLPFPGILRLVRFTIGVGIGLRLAFSRAIAVAGMPHPPHLIGMLRRRGWVSAAVGTLKFKAQFDHQRGTAVIDSSLEPPVLYFTTHQPSRVQDLRISRQHKGSILFQIPIPDIIELKKTEQLGWKQKLILEVTGGIKYSVDGLVLCGKSTNESFHLTAIRNRDQLFNRLVAMGAQFWENC